MIEIVGTDRSLRGRIDQRAGDPQDVAEVERKIDGRRMQFNEKEEEKNGKTAFKRPGAGSGNRTRVFSLEGCCSTIELYPRAMIQGRMVEGVGFEPT